eukprot:Pgem_evm2s1015
MPKPMSIKKGRKIYTKTVPKMLCWLHYKFKQRLMAKSELFNDCNVIECDESFTFKACGYSGGINSELGLSKVFICKQNQCQVKFISSDCEFVIFTRREI